MIEPKEKNEEQRRKAQIDEILLFWNRSNLQETLLLIRGHEPLIPIIDYTLRLMLCKFCLA